MNYEENIAQHMNKQAKRRRNRAIAVVVGGIVVVSIGVGASMIEKIPAGYLGVVYTPSTGAQDDTLNQGWHLVSPLKSVTKFSVATEQLYMSSDEREGSKDDDSFETRAKDGKLNVDLEMSYRFDAEKVSDLFVKYRGMSGNDIMNSIVRGKIKTYVNEVTSQYSVLEVHLEKKAEVNAKLLEYLNERLEEFGIIVESCNLTKTVVDPAIEQAIVERGKANQELEAEKQKTLKAEEEAKRLKVEAEGKAEVKRIEAEAQAEANKLIEQTLTKEMVEKAWIDKWDGKLPTVQGANGVVMMPGQGQNQQQ